MNNLDYNIYMMTKRARAIRWICYLFDKRKRHVPYQADAADDKGQALSNLK